MHVPRRSIVVKQCQRQACNPRGTMWNMMLSTTRTVYSQLTRDVSPVGLADSGPLQPAFSRLKNRLLLMGFTWQQPSNHTDLHRTLW